ncbi:MAG: MFS transporter [Acidobacteriota bacterium]|nr:MFS transporter [Acidobacteriota bacterium]
MPSDDHPTGSSPGDSIKHDPYAALRQRDFRLFLIGHVLSVLGVQMQNVAVGWQLYDKTNSAWPLAMVGLVQAAPMIGLALPAGQIADRFDRRKILMMATLLAVISAIGLMLVSMLGGSVRWMYFCLFLSGLARAFQGPARSSLMPQLVPRSLFTNSVSWAVSGFEMASLAGPALGGILIGVFGGATKVYLLGALGSVFYFSMLAAITNRAYVAEDQTGNLATNNWHSIAVGFKYVWKTKLLLTVMSLDMFAVLLGGAVALLPVYARDILHVGPAGLGWLQAAPSVGAVTMALLTTHLPPLKKAGSTLLWSVAGFGLATIVFGLSNNFWLSVAMLFLTGAFDNISVVIRHTLVQTLTPDEMRGRVSAVNGMFINTSNEIGRFESGAVASLTNAVFSVVSGGIGTLIVVAATAFASPQLRRHGSLHEESNKH